MKENPYESPKVPSEPGRRFPWKRVFIGSAVVTSVSGAIWYPVMRAHEAFGEMHVYWYAWFGSFAVLNTGLLAMAVSFVFWRTERLRLRAGRSDSDDSS
jgi:hypothetical protein